MVNAISLFSRPIGVRKRLSKKKSPYELTETFVGDGCSTSYTLNIAVPSEDVDNALFTIKVADKKYKVNYDSTNNCIILPSPITMGEKFILSVYYVGAFEETLYDEEIYILGQWLMVCWSEYVQNNKMDIDRLLGDTDFKLTANANTTNAKTNWYVVNRENTTKYMNNYAWECEYSHYRGRYRR